MPLVLEVEVGHVQHSCWGNIPDAVVKGHTCIKGCSGKTPPCPDPDRATLPAAAVVNAYVLQGVGKKICQGASRDAEYMNQVHMRSVCSNGCVWTSRTWLNY